MRSRQVRGTRTPRGATYIFFALVVFPTLMLVLALVGDVARTIIAQRQVANAAQAAALAGAWQVRQGSSVIDQCTAAYAVVDTYNSAVSSGMLTAARPAPIPSGNASTVSVCPPPPGWVAPSYMDGYLNIEFTPERDAKSVTVTAGWELPNVLFASFFGLGLSYSGQPVTVVASICDPRDPSGVTEGYCVRPQ